MANQYGHHSKMIMQLLRAMTSSPGVGDVKGDTCRRSIYPPSLIVIAFIFWESRRGGGESTLPPGRSKKNKKNTGLKRVKRRDQYSPWQWTDPVDSYPLRESGFLQRLFHPMDSNPMDKRFFLCIRFIREYTGNNRA